MARPAPPRVSQMIPRALAAACDNLREALIIIDGQRVIRYINSAAGNLLGGAHDPVSQLTKCSAVLRCGDQDTVSLYCGECWGARALKEGVATPYFEAAIGPGDARVWVEGTCAPVPGFDGYAVFTLQPHPRVTRARAAADAAAGSPTEQGLSVAQSLVRTARELMGADYAALGRVDTDAAEVVWLAQEGNLSPTTARSRVPLGYGVRGQVVATGRSLLVTRFPEEAPDLPEQHPTMQAEGLQAALAVPVHVGSEPSGVLMVGSRQTMVYGAESERVLSSLAGLAGALLNDADGTRSARAASIQAEREWLAAELHDGLAQSLAALTQKLKLVRWLMGRSAESASLNGLLQEVLELSEHTHLDLRRALGDLNSSVTDGDFLPALQSYLATFVQRSSLTVELVDVPEQRPNLSAEVALQVLRVIQEALTNAHKHSAGSRVLVGWSLDRHGHTFTVSDNGRGFTRQQGGRGFGLTIMAERARRIGGRLTVTTGPEKGCTVSLCVPHPAGGGMTIEPDPGVAS